MGLPKKGIYKTDLSQDSYETLPQNIKLFSVFGYLAEMITGSVSACAMCVYSVA